MSSSGAAEQKPQLTSSTDEPSMEEILASIRDIISEDEAAVSSHEKRENFSHPDKPSNTNMAAKGTAQEQQTTEAASTIEQKLQVEIEAEMNRDLAGGTVVENVVPANGPEAILAVDLAASSGTPGSANNVEITYDTTAVASQVSSTSVGGSLQERAQKVREKLGLAEAGSVTLEERLEKYRVRGRQQASEQSVIPNNHQPPSVNMAQNLPKAEQVVTDTPEGVANLTADLKSEPSTAIAMPNAEGVARALLDSHTGTMGKELDAQIRPMVRQWLNDNLPTLVERLVREEIQRVSQIRKASA